VAKAVKTVRELETKEEAKNENNNKLLSAEDTQSLRYTYLYWHKAKSLHTNTLTLTRTLQLSTEPNQSGSTEAFSKETRKAMLYMYINIFNIHKCMCVCVWEYGLKSKPATISASANYIFRHEELPHSLCEASVQLIFMQLKLLTKNCK